MKTWQSIDWGEACPSCGAGAEVLTDAPPGMAHDSDVARCVECHAAGSVTVPGKGTAYVNWDETKGGDG